MDKLFTPAQTAEHLCVSEMTLRKWRWEGKGPRFIKLGRKVAYKKQDICDWVDGQSRSSTSDTGNISQQVH